MSPNHKPGLRPPGHGSALSSSPSAPSAARSCPKHPTAPVTLSVDGEAHVCRECGGRIEPSTPEATQTPSPSD